jgi:hypothetical protein
MTGLDDIKKFKNFTDCWSCSYKYAIFSYVAIKRNDKVPTIVCATINLFPRVNKQQIEFFVHETQSVVAGRTIWELDKDPLCFLSSIEEGIVFQPDGKQLHLFDKDNS